MELDSPITSLKTQLNNIQTTIEQQNEKINSLYNLTQEQLELIRNNKYIIKYKNHRRKVRIDEDKLYINTTKGKRYLKPNKLNQK